MPGGEQQEARLTSRSDHGGKLYGPHEETGCEAPLTLYGQHQDQIHILKTKHPDVSADDGRPGRSQVQRGPADNSGEKGGGLPCQVAAGMELRRWTQEMLRG